MHDRTVARAWHRRGPTLARPVPADRSWNARRFRGTGSDAWIELLGSGGGEELDEVVR